MEKKQTFSWVGWVCGKEANFQLGRMGVWKRNNFLFGEMGIDPASSALHMSLQDYAVEVLVDLDSSENCWGSSLFLNETDGNNIIELCNVCNGPITAPGPNMVIT